MVRVSGTSEGPKMYHQDRDVYSAENFYEVTSMALLQFTF
jgi:hypothetical protein